MWRNLLEELAHVTTEADKLQTGCLRTREASRWWISQSETDMPESSRNLLGRPNPDLTYQDSKITVEKVWGWGKRIFPSPTCWFGPCQSDGAGLHRVGICLLSISVPVPSSEKPLPGMEAFSCAVFGFRGQQWQVPRLAVVSVFTHSCTDTWVSTLQGLLGRLGYQFCVPTKSGPPQQCDLPSVILKFLKYCDEVHTA